MVRFGGAVAALVAGAVWVAVLVAPARADHVDNQADVCGKWETTEPDMLIGACTAVIQSGRWSGKDLAWAYINRGLAYDKKGEHDRAIQDYDQALKLDPNGADIYRNRGLAYVDKGQYDRAIQDFDQAIRLKPDYADAYNSRGAAYAFKGQDDRAIQDYDQAIRLDPRVRHAHRNRGRAYARKGQFERAMQDFDEAIRLKPDDADAYLYRSSAKVALGRHEEALTDADAAGRLTPDAAGTNNQRCWVRGLLNRDLNTALDLCNRAVGATPNYANGLNSRGFVHFRLGDMARARADYDAALAIEPRQAASLFMRGIIKRRMGDNAGAAADIAAAKAIEPGVASRYARYGVSDSGAPAAAPQQPVQPPPVAVAPPPPPVAVAPPPPAAAPTGPAPGFHSAPLVTVTPGREMLDTNQCQSSSNLEKALRACREIIRYGRLSGVKLGAYHNRCAEILLQLGRNAEALDDMEKAMELDPVNRNYEANLALVKARAGR